MCIGELREWEIECKSQLKILLIYGITEELIKKRNEICLTALAGQIDKMNI